MMRGWDTLRKHAVEFNILFTVHAVKVEIPMEAYRFFRDVLNAKFIQIIPMVDRVNADLLPAANLGLGKAECPFEITRNSSAACFCWGLSP